MVCLITSKVLLVVKGRYVGSVGLPSAVGQLHWMGVLMMMMLQFLCPRPSLS